MKIFVLGGDGFCGWPTALHLSKQGHEITILDNLCRRAIDYELGTQSLTPIQPIEKRIKIWKDVTGLTIEYKNINLATEFQNLCSLLKQNPPDAIIHFAEQRAAPYSMKSANHKVFTVNNNINVTNNLLAACVDTKSNAHILHLGTMGVYGYSTDLPIPEGYLKVQVETKDNEHIQKEILYPSDPGSVYHTTKAMDQVLFQFYNKNDNLRITDLHQGIVWGTQTPETDLHEGLINRFDYDGDFGTVLNRFIVQSAINVPLSVFGIGGQTRAFIHIKDCVKAIELAISEPPQKNDHVRIINQITEVHKVLDLAELIKKLTGAEIQFLDNPRVEAVSNTLNPMNHTLIGLGLHPHKLANQLIDEIRMVADKYRSRIDPTKIPCTSFWVSKDAS